MYSLQIRNRETGEWQEVAESNLPSRRKAVKKFRETEDLTRKQWKVRVKE